MVDTTSFAKSETFQFHQYSDRPVQDYSQKQRYYKLIFLHQCK
jgi:hypothetical protein